MKRDAFTAIADPTRRAIIDLLADDKMNINQVADHFDDISRQGVSKQLKYLEDAGLVTMQKQGRERYCYLNWSNLNEVNDWLKKYEKFWNVKHDNLGRYLDGE